MTTQFSESAVAAILAKRIKDGTYAPGGRLPAERVLAEEFGISRRFARMAYATLVEQGLLEKFHHRSPFVAFPGGGHSGEVVGEFSTGAQTIAAVLPSNSMFPGGMSIISGIHKVLADTESSCRLTFLDTFHHSRSEVLRRETQAINTALDGGAAGLLWWCYSDEAKVREIREQHPETPIVFIDRHPCSLECDFVGIDDIESSQMAVEYLFSLGHTRIAHLMDPGNYSTILERAQGYRAAHQARGLPVPEELMIHLDWDERRMKQACRHLYSLPEPPTALFTSNDFIAYEFIKVVEAEGIQVPKDLSVVGHGNIDRYSPRGFLTSVEQPFDKMGRAATRLMLKRLASSAAPTQSYQQVILPAPLITRDSCRALHS